MEMKLTERQKRFADYYLELGNAVRAAEKAGYSPRSAATVKRQPAVKAYLDARLAQMDQARVASADEVLEYLTNVLRGEAGGGGQSAMKAAELLGKRLGLFAEQGESLPAPVIIDDIPGQIRIEEVEGAPSDAD